MEKRPLNLIWRRSVLDGVLEAAFLRDVLLADIGRPQRWIAVEDDAELPHLDDVLVCSFGDCGDYLRSLRSNNHANIGLLHLGDERRTDDVGFYAEADYVLRHYHRTGMAASGGHCRGVTWIPNGWASGIGPRSRDSQLPYNQRSHEMFFAGHVGSDDARLPERHAMLDALKSLGRPATIMLTPGFAQGLGAAAYAGYLGDSKFALAPAGNAPESIRFYDALECGALPVVIDAPWLHAPEGVGALGPPPLPMLSDWRELHGLTAEDWHEEARQAATAWWADLQAHAAAVVAEVIETAFRAA